MNKSLGRFLAAAVALLVLPFLAFGTMLKNLIRCSLVEGFALRAMRCVSPQTPVTLDSDIIRQLVAWGILDAKGGVIRRPPVTKTANYVVVPGSVDPCGTVFNTRGAVGSVQFTVPDPTPALAGYVYDFYNEVGQNMVVRAVSAGKLIAVNNAAVTTITVSTVAQLVGAHVRMFCDGTSWLAVGDSVGVTYTLA